MTMNKPSSSAQGREQQPQPGGNEMNVNMPSLYVRPGEHFQWQAQIRRGGTDRNLAMLQARLNSINRENATVKYQNAAYDLHMREQQVQIRKYQGKPLAAWKLDLIQKEAARTFPELVSLGAKKHELFRQDVDVNSTMAQERRFPVEGVIGKRMKEWWEHDPNEAAQSEEAIHTIDQVASFLPVSGAGFNTPPDPSGTGDAPAPPSFQQRLFNRLPSSPQRLRTSKQRAQKGSLGPSAAAGSRPRIWPSVSSPLVEHEGQRAQAPLPVQRPAEQALPHEAVKNLQDAISQIYALTQNNPNYAPIAKPLEVILQTLQAMINRPSATT